MFFTITLIMLIFTAIPANLFYRLYRGGVNYAIAKKVVGVRLQALSGVALYVKC